MGRSSRQQADANRARIVEIASGLFRARGIEAVSIGDVMKAAGLTQGGFYRHFASKDALAAEAPRLRSNRRSVFGGGQPRKRGATAGTSPARSPRSISPPEHQSEPVR